VRCAASPSLASPGAEAPPTLRLSVPWGPASVRAHSPNLLMGGGGNSGCGCADVQGDLDREGRRAATHRRGNDWWVSQGIWQTHQAGVPRQMNPTGGASTARRQRVWGVHYLCDQLLHIPDRNNVFAGQRVMKVVVRSSLSVIPVLFGPPWCEPSPVTRLALRVKREQWGLPCGWSAQDDGWCVTPRRSGVSSGIYSLLPE
jgi:hypothetical protein